MPFLCFSPALLTSSDWHYEGKRVNIHRILTIMFAFFFFCSPMRPCLLSPSPRTVIHSSTFLTLALENVAKNPTHQSRPPCPTSPSASSAAVCQANITFVRRTCITVTSICEAVTRSVIWQPRFWPIGRLVSVLLMFAAVNDAALLCVSYARETIRQKCLFVLNNNKKKKVLQLWLEIVILLHCYKFACQRDHSSDRRAV